MILWILGRLLHTDIDRRYRRDDHGAEYKDFHRFSMNIEHVVNISDVTTLGSRYTVASFETMLV